MNIEPGTNHELLEQNIRDAIIQSRMEPGEAESQAGMAARAMSSLTE